MRCGHLFNGIGGFALAAHWMDWKNVWHSEIDEFCNRVMNYHFPESKQYGDIKKTDWTKVEAVDLVTGGFPCQPFSQAGRRGGTQDDRYLWPAMFEAIKCVSPTWVVAENVYGILNWSDGMVIDTVLSDLESEGYEVATYVLPAAGTGAPHRRYRVWIVAYSESNGKSGTKSGHRREKDKKEWAKVGGEFVNNGSERSTSNPDSERSQGPGWTERSLYPKAGRDWEKCGAVNARRWPTQSPVCRGNDGIPDRVDRIKALGNAIVPQVALQIFRAIKEYEHKMKTGN